jgi:hypothetical protein
MLLILPLIHKHLFIQRSLQHLQYVAIPSCRIDDIPIFPSAPFAQTQASKTKKEEEDGGGENGTYTAKSVFITSAILFTAASEVGG